MKKTLFSDPYRFHRLAGRTAIKALELARVDVAKNVQRYPDASGKGWPGHTYCNKDTGAIFIENLADAGLRFVGWADKIATHIDHRGWYCDEFQDRTLRGAVVQLPGRNGKSLLLEAYHCSESDENAYVVFPNDIHEVDNPGQYDSLSEMTDTRDVARYADREAERAAETERDYDRAWQLGSQYSNLGTEIETTRKETLAILKEFRAARKAMGQTAYAKLCATITASVSSNLREMRNAREKRASILSDNYFRGELASAFNDGAGESVVS